MKTKAFLMVCFFACISVTTVLAQNSKNGNGADVYKIAKLGWECPVYCGGELVDIIGGYGEAHLIDHYKLGEWNWEILTIKGVGWSYATKEKFTFSEQDKIKWSPKVNDYSWTAHDNIKMMGDHGTLYNISLIVHWWDGTVEVKNAICTGNSK